MVFKPSQKRTSRNIQLLINCQQIDQVRETVYLEIIIDGILTWQSEISHVANKLSKSTGINPQIELLFIQEIFRRIVLFTSLSISPLFIIT